MKKEDPLLQMKFTLRLTKIALDLQGSSRQDLLRAVQIEIVLIIVIIIIAMVIGQMKLEEITQINLR